MLTPSQQRDLLARYRRRIDRYLIAAADIMVAAWLELASLDEEDIGRLTTLAGPAMNGVGERTANLAAGVASLIVDRPTTGSLTVVEPDWRGPFTYGWKALGNGLSFDEALRSGAGRAEAAGRNAVASTARKAAGAGAPDTTRWRRQLDADPCDWCVLVADRGYGSAEAADFGHDRCGCLAVPVT